MMLSIKIIYKTPLYCAVENKSTEIIRLLLQNPNIDVNIDNVFSYQLFK